MKKNLITLLIGIVFAFSAQANRKNEKTESSTGQALIEDLEQYLPHAGTYEGVISLDNRSPCTVEIISSLNGKTIRIKDPKAHDGMTSGQVSVDRREPLTLQSYDYYEPYNRWRDKYAQTIHYYSSPSNAQGIGLYTNEAKDLKMVYTPNRKNSSYIACTILRREKI